MSAQLDEIEALCSEHGIAASRVDSNRVDLRIRGDCTLSFRCLPEEEGILVGFEGTPWHCHGGSVFMTGEATFVKHDELELVIGLITGELVIVSRYMGGRISDRWLAHRSEKLDVKHIGPGEELRLFRMEL